MVKIKEKLKTIKRECATCGKEIRVIVYKNHTYRGGHYFGKIALENKEKVEYWECPKCYW